ncbi:hypothetical protein Tco_1336603, partial [Tanacetum coccineum]
SYKCQLDEQWFDLTKDTLRDALQITPVDNNRAFSPPTTPDTLVERKSYTCLMSPLMTCSNRGGHSQPLSICALRERLLDLKGQEPQCYKSFGVLSIELTSTMLKGCGKNLLNWGRTYSREEESNSYPYPEYQEPVLGHLKFSAKGSKREVFGMTIPNELINDVIRGADYYDAYLEKVVKHQRYIAGEELSDLESPAPKPAGKVVKKRTVKRSKQLVDEFIHEGVPAAKPRFEDTKEAILQKVLEESLTDAYPTQRGPLPLVVFRETDIGKHQPLPEVPGKGKEKVESSSLYAELGLSGSDTKSDEEMPSVIRSGAQDEGQAGPDPGKLDEGQAGPNPDDVAESQPLPTPSVLAGPNLEHSDVEIIDPSSQLQPEHMDDGFTTVAYPNVQENLKLTVDEQVILEEPVSSTRTLSSLQHLTKDFSFGDQFLNDKPSEADNEKTTTDTEAESMVSVTI